LHDICALKSFSFLIVFDCFCLDFTKLLSASSELLSQLPITNETKQSVYNIIKKIVNGNVTLGIGVDELRQIPIVSNTVEVENVPSIGVSQHVQTSLNSIFDELWPMTDPEHFMNVQIVFNKIRQLFYTLCDRIEKTEKQYNECCQRIQAMEKRLDDAAISSGHLLLGSVATHIMIKMGKFLNPNESPMVGAYRSFSEFNTLNNIELLKSFMVIHGITWDDARTITKMLKANRVSTAHPNSTNTTKQDIDSAINNCYPDQSSNYRIKAQQGLKLLELLANKLKEPLFVSM
jgi:hypothetical protein